MASYKEQFDSRIWTLFWGQIISSTGRLMVFPFIALYLRQHLGVAIASIGFYLGLSSLAGLATSLISGTVSDRIGRKPVLVGSLVSEAVILALFPFAGSVGHFVILNALLSAGIAFFSPANHAVISDITPPDKRARAYGLIRVAGNLGAVLGPLAGSVLVGISFPLTFWTAAALSLTYAIIVLVLITETKPESTSMPVGVTANPGGYSLVWHDTLFLLVMGAFVLVSISYAQVDSLMAVYITEHLTLPQTVFGMLIAVNGGMIVLFQTMVSAWTERGRAARYLILSGLLYAIGYLVTRLAGTPSTLVIGMVIITLGEMVGFPTYIKLIAAMAPIELRARYMAVGDLPFNISRILGPILGGLVMDYLGSPAIWTMAAVLSACTAFAYTVVARQMNLREENLDKVGTVV